MKIVHLLSGGLDSVVLLYELSGEGMPIHCAPVDYGQRHVQELFWAKHHCKRLNVPFDIIKLPQLEGSALTDGFGGVIVPNRNAILLSHAVNLAVAIGFDTVTIGANGDDAESFPDCTKAFLDAYNYMLTRAGIRVQVIAPYRSRSKAWIAALGRDLGVRLEETWSCYRGGKRQCGKCPACLKRRAALL